MTTKEETRCGFVVVLGVPNSGKSTLINELVGAKVSIVTHKVQTTRMRILGLAIKDHSQIILVDTPGIFTPKHRLERSMVKAAWTAIQNADLVSVIVDAHKTNLEGSESILEQLNKSGHEPVLLLNKTDLAQTADLLRFAKKLTHKYKIRDTFMISALRGDGVQDVLSYFSENIPFSPWLYPADQLTDLPERLLASEITREKVFLYLHQELPYAIAVETESWEEFDDGSVKITQMIYVQRASQKPIVLGKGGQQIKLIGQKAREELTSMFDRKVHLFLHVKVKENWLDKPSHYRMLGLEFDV